MPYIITTRSPEYPGAPDLDATERRAVATLEEALEHVSATVCDLMAGENFGQYQDEFRAITEAGGTVGPLPDGTVIEVRRVLYGDVMREAGLSRRDTPFMSDAQILAAFNAETVR